MNDLKWMIASTDETSVSPGQPNRDTGVSPVLAIRENKWFLIRQPAI